MSIEYEKCSIWAMEENTMFSFIQNGNNVIIVKGPHKAHVTIDEDLPQNILIAMEELKARSEPMFVFNQPFD